MADIVNIIFVFIGVFFIVKPPFVFGSSEIYSQDPQAIYAAIAVVLGAIFFQANCFVTSRMLKGKYFFIRMPSKFKIISITKPEFFFTTLWYFNFEFGDSSFSFEF